MERERPPYLGDLPRDRRGNWAMYLLAAGLLAALIGGWKIYASTVEAWHARYNAPAAAKAPARSEAASIDPAAAALQRERAARIAEIAEQRLRELQRDRASWKCINGTAFRPLPGGGWENVPGVRC